MLRFEGFCDDKNAAKVMHAVNGLVLDFKIVPVVNAVAKKNGKVEAKTDGSNLELFAAALKEHKIREFGKSFIKEFLVKNGRSESSAQHLATYAMEAKLIKRVDRGKYVVNPTRRS